MRIAAIVPALRRTAPVMVALDLCRGFAQRGHEVVLFYIDPIVELTPEVPVAQIGPRSLHQLHAFEVVHSHMLRPDVLAVLSQWASCGNFVSVSTIHNYVEEDLRNTHGSLIALAFSAIWRRIWARFDCRVVLSLDAIRYYKSFQPNLSFECIPNGRPPHLSSSIQIEEHHQLTELARNKIMIGANALISRRKGLEQVIYALQRLPEFAFVVVGDGPALLELKALALKLGVADRFVPLGFKKNARDYLDYYHIYVMPSRSEGLPLALLEAAAAGLPCVCSDLPVFREIFEPTQAAFFSLDTEESLVAAIRHARENSKSLGSAAKSRFEAAYSEEAMVDGYLRLFWRLLERRASGVSGTVKSSSEGGVHGGPQDRQT